VSLGGTASRGGTARFARVTLALPPDTPIEMVEGIYRGLAEAAAASGTAVVGGNVSRTSGPLIIDVTALGEAQTVLRRDGAQPGDGVWVTGAVGKAAAGLFLLRHPQARAAGAGDRSPPPLPFPVQENYIPSKVSTIKSLEYALIDAFDRLPVVTDAAVHDS